MSDFFDSLSKTESDTVRAERLGIHSLLERLKLKPSLIFTDPIKKNERDITFASDLGFCQYYRLSSGVSSIEDSDGKCGVAVDAVAAKISVWSDDSICKFTDRRLWHELIRYGVATYLSDLGYTPIHAAAVIAPSGDSWLICGQTHAGKSTLVVGLLEAGWQFLGDDGLVLADEDGETVAHAWLGTSLLAPILLGTYPHLESKLGAVIGDRRLIDLNNCYPTQWVAKTKPRGLLFPAFSSTTQIAELQPISTGMVLGNLMTHAAMCLIEAPQSHLLHLQQLTNRCKHFNLLLGSELQNRPHLVADLLQSIVA
jgi:hypothetical protein